MIFNNSAKMIQWRKNNLSKTVVLGQVDKSMKLDPYHILYTKVNSK